MKQKLIIIGSILGAVFLPLSTFASTYLYVTTGGNIKAVTADTSAQVFASAKDIDAHSGVMLEPAWMMIYPDTVVVNLPVADTTTVNTNSSSTMNSTATSTNTGTYSVNSASTGSAYMSSTSSTSMSSNFTASSTGYVPTNMGTYSPYNSQGTPSFTF